MFLNTSLEKLVNSLAKSGYDQFQLTKKRFPNSDLLFAKGIYPYEYATDRSKFLETSLPPIDKFYSSLTEECITPEEYERAKLIWTTFNCKTLQDYHDLYLMTDVLLLALYTALKTLKWCESLKMNAAARLLSSLWVCGQKCILSSCQNPKNLK
jgi:hypothetical protein